MYGNNTSTVCPWTKAEHLDGKRSICYIEHCLSHEDQPFHYGSTPFLKEKIFGASFIGVVSANLRLICILFKRSDYGILGVLANVDRKDFLGYFTMPASPGCTPQIRQCFATQDFHHLVVTEMYSPHSAEYAVHLFTCEQAFEEGDRLVKFKQIGLHRKLRSGATSAMLMTVIVSLPDHQNGYVVMPLKSKSSSNELLVLYNFRTTRKINSCYFPWTVTEPDAEEENIWLQNVTTSPDGALVFACCQTAANGEAGSFIVIHHAYGLNVLHVIHIKREPEYWWDNAYRGCYSVVTPTFSASGYQMALLCWETMETYTTTEEGDKAQDGWDCVAVFSLPCLALELRAQCRKAILQLISHKAIHQLNLPNSVKDYLRYD